MRLRFAAPAVIAICFLTACSGGKDNDFPPTCAEQSDLAKLGRTDGKDIRITCP